MADSILCHTCKGKLSFASPIFTLMSQMVLNVSSLSAVCRVSCSLNGPKATVKALTEKVYWVPGVRSDSTAVVVLPVVFTKKFTPKDGHRRT